VSRGTVGERCGREMCPRVPKVSPGLFMTGLMRTFRRRKRGKVSPEGAAQPCRGTLCGCNVSQGCRRCLRAYSRRDQCGRFGNEKVAKCRPRVSRGTVGERCGLGTSPRVPKVPPSLFKTGSMRMFRQRKSGKVLPKGVARLCWGTLRGFNVAQGYRAELLGNVLGAVMSLESAAQPCCGNDVGVKCVQGCRRYLRAYSRRLQGELSSDEKVAKCCPRVSRRTVVERFGAVTSPEGVARPCCGTMWA